MRAGAKEEAEEAFLLPEQYPASHNHWRAYSYQGAGKQASRPEQAGASPHSLFPADLGLLHRPQIGIIDDALLPIPAAGQGGVLLQHRSILLLSSRIVL